MTPSTTTEGVFEKAQAALSRSLPVNVTLTGTQERAIVRAVLSAIMEPDEGMYDALCATGKMWRELDSATVWKTYVSAIIREGE